MVVSFGLETIHRNMRRIGNIMQCGKRRLWLEREHCACRAPFSRVEGYREADFSQGADGVLFEKGTVLTGNKKQEIGLWIVIHGSSLTIACD